MKTIESSFTYDQFTFTLLKRQGMIALFQKTKTWHEIPRTKTFLEVVRIRRMPAKTFLDGRTYPDREAMPQSEDWGTDGFSCGTLEAAEERFQKMVKEDQEK